MEVGERTMAFIRNCIQIACVLAVTVNGGERAPREIHIESGWGGLGKPQSFELTIRSDHGAYRADGRKVKPELVKALVDALMAPPLVRPTRENLGLTAEWLRANASRVFAQRHHSFSHQAANIQKLELDAFSDPDVVDRLLPGIFDSFHTDDYPHVYVHITFGDGASLSAESHAQGPYMLPWNVTPSATTYDVRIARAIAALLPEKAANRERMIDDDLPQQLADAVARSLEERIKNIDADNRAHETLELLRQRYSIQHSEINPYHDPAYGTEWKAGRTGETNLKVRLHRSGLPPNLSTFAVLLHEHGLTEGADRFLGDVTRYESLVTSTPWLMDYMRSHPHVHFNVLYVHDASFGDHAFETFTKDMRARQKPELIERVGKIRRELALLTVANGGTKSYWLLFPDHRALLWRYEGLTEVLKWKASDFAEPRCGDYQVNNGGCPAAEVTADGTLVSGSHADEACIAAFQTSHHTTIPEIDPLFPVQAHDRGGFINHSGDVIVPLCFDTVAEFSEGLARFERDGRWGYINRAGHIVIQPQFMWARDFSDGLARVQISGIALGANARWGFIDKSGKVVIQLTKDQSGYGTEEEGFHEGLAFVGEIGKKGFIDKTGKYVTPVRYGFGYGFQDGLAAVSEDSRGEHWGFIDKTGKWIIPPSFDWADPFEEGLATVNRKRDCGFVDRTGAFVLKPPVPEGETDCAAVWGSFHNGLARWRFGKKFGYIDHTGKTVIEARYDFTPGFSEGLAAVQLNGKWGYIDTAGKTVIEPRELDAADPFRNGLAHVATKDGKHGYIDRTGKYVWGPQKQSAER